LGIWSILNYKKYSLMASLHEINALVRFYRL
jgi:hypothetical protein